MDPKSLPSYQELWLTAEEVSKHSLSSRDNLYSSIKSIMDDYEKLDKIPAPEIAKMLKTKKLGELLFKIAELSRLDDVNVYLALQQEILINQR